MRYDHLVLTRFLVVLVIFVFSQRFVDVCNKRVDSLVLTIAKDLSLMKKGVSGEFLVNKVCTSTALSHFY